MGEAQLCCVKGSKQDECVSHDGTMEETGLCCENADDWKYIDVTGAERCCTKKEEQDCAKLGDDYTWDQTKCSCECNLDDKKCRERDPKKPNKEANECG